MSNRISTVIKAVTDLPARLFGGNAQTVEVSGLDYTLHLDLSKLPEAEAGTSPGKWTVVWDEVTNTYRRVEFTNLPASTNVAPEAVDDRVAQLLKPGANIAMTYDDPGNALYIAAAGVPGAGGPAIVFDTIAEAQGATVDVTNQTIILTGATYPGDAAQVLICRRAPSEPTHEGKLRTLDRFTSNLVVDATNGGWWEFVPPQEGIAIEWFGGQNDCPYWPNGILESTPLDERGTDNFPAYEKAATYLQTLSAAYSTALSLRFRKNGVYYFSESIQIYGTTTLEGHNTGHPGSLASFLLFAEGAHGIITHFGNTRQVYARDGAGHITSSTPTSITPRPLATGSLIKGLYLQSVGERHGGPNNIIAHAIWMRARCTVEKCNIAYWSGDGIRAWANTGGDVNTSGNVNGSKFDTLRIGGTGMDGIHMQGGDANACVGISLDFAGIGGWAINDLSFLGNLWMGCEADEYGLGNRAAHGVYKKYEVTTDPGGAVLTTFDGRPKADLATGAAFTGSDGYGYTRRDVGKWTSGTTYTAGQIVHVSVSVGFTVCVTAGSGTSTVQPVIGGTLADGYVWGDGQVGSFLWQKNSNLALGDTVIWGGFMYTSPNPASGHLTEPGVDGSHPVPDAIDNAVWTWDRSRVGADDPYEWSPSRVYVEGGPYRADDSNAQGNTFIGCYVEAGGTNKIGWPATVIGGMSMRNNNPTGQQRAGFTAGVAGPFKTEARFGSTYDIFNTPAGQNEMMLAHSQAPDEFLTLWGGPAGLAGVQIVGYRADLNAVSRGFGGPSEIMTLNNSVGLNAGRVEPPGPGQLMYYNGFYIGFGLASMRRMTAGPALLAPPYYSGENTKGDIHWNNDAAPGGFAGWICTTGGVSTDKTWTSGLTYTTNDYVTVGGTRYYHCTVAPATTATVTPTHTGVGAEVIGADGYGWTYISASAAVWKTFGAISA